MKGAFATFGTPGKGAAIAQQAALLPRVQAAYAASRVQGLPVGGGPVVGYARMRGTPSKPKPREELFLEPGVNLGQARLQAGRQGATWGEVPGWLT